MLNDPKSGKNGLRDMLRSAEAGLLVGTMLGLGEVAFLVLRRGWIFLRALPYALIAYSVLGALLGILLGLLARGTGRLGRVRPEQKEMMRKGEEDAEEREALVRCATLWERVDEKELRMGWVALVTLVTNHLPVLKRQPEFKDR